MNGLTLAIEAIIDELEDIYGRDRVKEIVYKAGHKLGEKEGKKLKSNSCSPENAINLVLKNVSSFYKTHIADIIRKEGEIEVAIQVKECSFRKVLEDRGYKTPGIICRFMVGYIEGALATMTKMKVKHRVYTSSISNMCVGSIKLSKK